MSGFIEETVEARLAAAERERDEARAERDGAREVARRWQSAAEDYAAAKAEAAAYRARVAVLERALRSLEGEDAESHLRRIAVLEEALRGVLDWTYPLDLWPAGYADAVRRARRALDGECPKTGEPHAWRTDGCGPEFCGACGVGRRALEGEDEP